MKSKASARLWISSPPHFLINLALPAGLDFLFEAPGGALRAHGAHQIPAASAGVAVGRALGLLAIFDIPAIASELGTGLEIQIPFDNLRRIPARCSGAG
jgi:hypothetical protein